MLPWSATDDPSAFKASSLSLEAEMEVGSDTTAHRVLAFDMAAWSVMPGLPGRF